MTERNLFAELVEGFDALRAQSEAVEPALSPGALAEGEEAKTSEVQARRVTLQESKDAFEAFIRRVADAPEPHRSTHTYPGSIEAETCYRAFCAGAAWGAQLIAESLKERP